jgi:hypothetical protein
MPTDIYVPYNPPKVRTRMPGSLGFGIGLFVWAILMIAITLMAGVTPVP